MKGEPSFERKRQVGEHTRNETFCTMEIGNVGLITSLITEKCHFVWLKCPTFKILVKKRVKQCKDINIKILKINLGNVDTEVQILMTFFTEMVAVP